VIAVVVFMAGVVLTYALGVRHMLRAGHDKVEAWLLPYFVAWLWPFMLAFWPWVRRDGESFFWFIDP
jgi:hypothetical protein